MLFFLLFLFPFPGINFGLALGSSVAGEAFCQSVQVTWDGVLLPLVVLHFGARRLFRLLRPCG